MEQKSFLSETWKVGDTVLINDRQGKIVLYSPKGDKVQVEYRDALEGETYKRWHKIGELPDKPAADVPLHVPTEEDEPEFATGANPDVKRRREIKCEAYTVRNRGGFDMEGASARLTALVSDGWQLQHIEHQTIWIPAKSSQEQSYVETTVFWTLDRVVEVSE